MSLMLTHVYFGEKYYSEFYLDNSHKEKFLIGNILPDIRYIDPISPQESHGSKFPVDISKIGKVCDIESGVFFHTVVDQIWTNEGFEKLIFGKYIDDIAKRTAIKLYVESLLYPLISDIKKVIKSLDTIYPEEEKFVKDKTNLQKWHKALQSYFSKGVYNETIEEFGLLTKTPKELTQKITALFHELSKDAEVKKKILIELDNFDGRYQIYKQDPYKLTEENPSILEY